MVPLIDAESAPAEFRFERGSNPLQCCAIAYIDDVDRLWDAIDLAQLQLSDELDAAGYALGFCLKIEVELCGDQIRVTAYVYAARGTWDFPPAHESPGRVSDGDTARCGVGGRG